MFWLGCVTFHFQYVALVYSETMAEAEVPTSPPEEKVEESQPTEPEATPSSSSEPPAGARAAPDGPQERKARAFMDEADKKVKSSQSFFGGLFG